MANYSKGTPRTIGQFDSEFENIETAINSHFDRNPAVGQANQMETNIDMNSYKINNLAAGTASTDAVNKSQLDDAVASVEVSSIAHIDEYVGTTASTALDLEAASDAVEMVVFGGTDITIEDDVTIDSAAVARVWDLQGATITLSDNADITIQKDDFVIINGTIDGGLKETFITSATATTPQTFSVDNPSAFEVGDHVSSSWSNGYLPNSPSNSSLTGGKLNTITGIAGSVYTMDESVDVTSANNGATSNILAENTRLFNARFDKNNIRFEGAGTYVLKNMTFQNCANAYYVEVVDSTETARVWIENCKFNSIALDAFKFQADTVVFDNCYCASPRDIGKQNIVWTNNTKRGRLAIRNSEFYNGTRDAFLFSLPSGTTTYVPDTYLENSTFDGNASVNNYTPNQIYNYSNAFHFLAFFDNDIGAAKTAQTVDVGKLTAVNCDFKAFSRAIWGSTFDGTSYIVSGITYNQDKVYFQNCLLDGTPVDIRDGGGTTDIESCVIDNCEIRFSGGVNERFMRGIREYYINNSLIKDNYPDTGGVVEATTTTSQDIYRGQIVELSTNGKHYLCVEGESDQYTVNSGDVNPYVDTSKFLEVTSDVNNGVFQNTIIEDRLTFDGNDIFWDKARFNKVASGITNKPTIQNFIQGKLYGSAVLLGADATDATEIDIEDWMAFNIDPDNKSENDLPLITFYVDNTSAIINYGGDETNDVGGDGDYHFELAALRSDPSVGDTSPLWQRGAFLYNPPAGSIVKFARDRSLKQIASSGAVTINSGTSGTDTITTQTSVTGTPYKGDWISLNEDGTEEVYFHEITAVSGSDPNYTLTVRPNLEFTADSSDNCQLIKHDWLYGAPVETVEVVRDSGTEFYTTTGTWTDIDLTTERRNEITYCSTTPASGTITLPRGKYKFEAQASFLHDSAASATASMRTSMRLVSAGSKFTSFRSTHDTDRTDSGTTQGTLTTHNHLTGVFELDDEDTVNMQVYTSQPCQIATSDSNNYSAILKITKIG